MKVRKPKSYPVKKDFALFTLTALTMILGVTYPLHTAEVVKAGDRPEAPTQPIAQSSLTRQQVLDACVQNRAETLPNPFVDVPETHWAYKAVLTLYYCGPYRQATPPSLIERLTTEIPGT